MASLCGPGWCVKRSPKDARATAMNGTKQRHTHTVEAFCARVWRRFCSASCRCLFSGAVLYVAPRPPVLLPGTEGRGVGRRCTPMLFPARGWGGVRHFRACTPFILHPIRKPARMVVFSSPFALNGPFRVLQSPAAGVGPYLDRVVVFFRRCQQDGKLPQELPGFCFHAGVPVPPF